MLETGQRGYLELPFDPVGGKVRARSFPLTPVDVFKNLWRRLKLLQAGAVLCPVYAGYKA